MMIRLIYNKVNTKRYMLHHLDLAYFVIAREGLSLTSPTPKSCSSQDIFRRRTQFFRA